MQQNNLINPFTDIFEKWEKYSTDIDRKSDRPLPEYNGYDIPKRNAMLAALLFWKFVREKLFFEYEGYDPSEVKRAFLKKFVQFPTTFKYKYELYIPVLAMVESLPGSVWRKLLWRKNIDFLTHESFLRRLELPQIRAIENAYNQLFTVENQQVPSIMTENVFGRITFFFKKNPLEKLLREDLFDEKRWLSKGAWAYELMGLDFGFGKYYKGTLDDAHLPGRDWRRFLSLKNHVNDFVVNQESGLYWWMYRTARKNYAWMFWSEEPVKLKTHICPGFWATLLLHLWFWLAPLLCFYGVHLRNTNPEPTLASNIYFIAGIIFPLWCLVAGIRLLLRSIFTEKVNDSLLTALKKRIGDEESLKKKIRIIGKFSLSCIVAAILCFTNEAISEVQLICMAICTVGLFSGWRLEDKRSDHSYIPLAVATAAIVLVQMFTIYTAAVAVGQFIVTHYVTLIAIAITLPVVIIIGKAEYYLIKDEYEKYFRISRYMMPVMLIWGFLFLSSLCMLMLYGIGFGGISWAGIGIAGLGAIALFVGIYIYMRYKDRITESTVAYVKEINEKCNNAIHRLKLATSSWLFTPFSCRPLERIIEDNIRQNKYLLNLDEESLESELELIAHYAKEIVFERVRQMDESNYNNTTRFISILVSHWDDKFKGQLAEHMDKIKEYTPVQITILTRYLAIEQDFKMAVARLQELLHQENMVKQQNEERALVRQERWHKTKKILIIPFLPFIWLIYKPLAWIFKKIKNFVVDTWDNVVMFQKRCPYVAPQEVLK